MSAPPAGPKRRNQFELRTSLSDLENALAEVYTGRKPITRGRVWRVRYLRQAMKRGAFTPLSVRNGRLIGRALWKLGFDYETVARWT